MKASGKHDDIKAHVVDKRLVIAIETDDGSGEPTRAVLEAGFGAGRARQGDLGLGYSGHLGLVRGIVRNPTKPSTGLVVPEVVRWPTSTSRTTRRSIRTG